MPRAFYSEFNPHAAQWLRNLIDADLIAYGDVDERDIRDITPNDLAGYTQCHFFAGIGVWSYALRMAGWPDWRPVWTGSPPCQPFSAAGRGGGTADERHLWPHLYHLIRVRRPVQFFGEQVASKDGLGWLDTVQADMEGTRYAGGAVDLCAAGVGAPHIRQRQFLFFSDTGVALGDSGSEGCTEQWGRWEQSERPGCVGRMADRDGGESGQGWGIQPGREHGQQPQDGGAGGWPGGAERSGEDGPIALADCGSERREWGQGLSTRCEHDRSDARRLQGNDGPFGVSETRDGREPRRPGPTNSGWADADWLFCRDGKWRPVKPGTFPLVDGTAFRLDSGSAYAGKSRAKLLEGAGNAIVSEAAAHVIAAFLDHERDAAGGGRALTQDKVVQGHAEEPEGAQVSSIGDLL